MTDLFIGRALLERVLARTMKTGADFAEIFAESTRRNSLYMIDGRIESASDSTISGVGLRAFKGLRCVSASTSDLSEAGLMRAAAQGRRHYRRGKRGNKNSSAGADQRRYSSGRGRSRQRIQERQGGDPQAWRECRLRL